LPGLTGSVTASYDIYGHDRRLEALLGLPASGSVRIGSPRFDEQSDHHEDWKRR
jgi:hypothetical protein